MCDVWKSSSRNSSFPIATPSRRLKSSWPAHKTASLLRSRNARFLINARAKNSKLQNPRSPLNSISSANTVKNLKHVFNNSLRIALKKLKLLSMQNVSLVIKQPMSRRMRSLARLQICSPNWIKTANIATMSWDALRGISTQSASVCATRSMRSSALVLRPLTGSTTSSQRPSRVFRPRSRMSVKTVRPRKTASCSSSNRPARRSRTWPDSDFLT